MYSATGLLRDGFIPVPGGYVWYRRVGRTDSIPLLVLHGGPGAGSSYLDSLQGLADEREVIFFDQLGCGKSEAPQNPALWRIERFVIEVETVRRALGLRKFHLLGHSWGGWLATEYMLTRPAGVVGLVLASTSASLPQYVQEIGRLRDQLPSEIRDTLREHEGRGTLDHPDYKAALLSFYQRHLCRLPLWPQTLVEAMRTTGNRVYTAMQGMNELVITGNLKNWDRTDRLAEIQVPTLVTVGRYDSITPGCAATLQAGISGARTEIFEQSAHMPHLEEPDRYLQVLGAFLHTAEGSANEVSPDDQGGLFHEP